MPRGLAAAILAINFGPDIVRDLGLNIDGFFKDTAFVIILGTAIICTIGVSIISYYEKKKLHDTKEQKNNYDNIDETLNKKQ
jgi:purine-cytosine permease-like protein